MTTRLALLLALPVLACTSAEDDPTAEHDTDGASTGATSDEPGSSTGADSDAGGTDGGTSGPGWDDDPGGTSGGTGGEDDSGGSTGGIEPPLEACSIVPPRAAPFHGGVSPDMLQWGWPMAGDTGLDDIQAVLATLGSGSKSVSIPVDGARVIAVGQTLSPSGTNRFWIADDNFAVLVKLAPGARINVSPGDNVSFKALSLQRVGYEPFISDMVDFTIDGAGPVAVTVPYGELSFLVSGHLLHRVHGRVEGDPFYCGVLEECQNFTYFIDGAPHGVTLRFDTMLFDSELQAGDCVEIQSPLGYDEGERIDVQNEDWVRTY